MDEFQHHEYGNVTHVGHALKKPTLHAPFQPAVTWTLEDENNGRDIDVVSISACVDKKTLTYRDRWHLLPSSEVVASTL